MILSACITQVTHFAHCSLCMCSSDFSVSHGGGDDVTTHVRGKHHKDIAKASSTSKSVASFQFRLFSSQF